MKKKKIIYKPFDAAAYLDNDTVITEYLSAAAEDPNPDVFVAALGHVAKARGMAQIAKNAGLGRESLYKTLSAGAHPRFETINSVLHALGVKFAVVAERERQGKATPRNFGTIAKPEANMRDATKRLGFELAAKLRDTIEGLRTKEFLFAQAGATVITLNTLLEAEHIDTKLVLVLRHTPKESQLSRALGSLAVQRPALFNAYQQTQSQKVEKQMQRAKYVASFIGHEPGKALFVGFYRVGATRPLTREQYWLNPEHIELHDKYGMKGFVAEKDDRSSILWFDLELMETYRSWQGKLIVKWPPPEISWSRWAQGQEMPVLAIREENGLQKPMPRWDEIDLLWEELSALPAAWSDRLGGWRAIYYIFDVSDAKGYVGCAYGETNLAQRWQVYAQTGHGGNRLLRERDPRNFRFSILQIVPPYMDQEDVIRVERTWKDRLHTRAPLGLNEN